MKYPRIRHKTPERLCIVHHLREPGITLAIKHPWLIDFIADLAVMAVAIIIALIGLGWCQLRIVKPFFQK